MLVGWQSCTIFNTRHLNLRRTVNCTLSSSGLTQNPAKGRRKPAHVAERNLLRRRSGSPAVFQLSAPLLAESTFGVPTTNCRTQAHFGDSIWARFPASPRSLQECSVNSQMCYYCYHLCANVVVQPFTYDTYVTGATKYVGVFWAWVKSNSY